MPSYQFQNQAVRVASTGQVYYIEDDTGSKFPQLQAQLEDPNQPVQDITTHRFLQLGLLSEDALEHEFADEVEDIISWQKGVVRSIVKTRDATFKLAALETSRASLELFYGSIMSTSPAGVSTLRVEGAVARRKMICVVEFQDGTLPDSTTPRIYRMILPSSQVSELESPKFSSGEAVSWGVTIKALGGFYDLITLVSNDPLLNSDDGGQPGSPVAPAVTAGQWA